MKFDIQQLVLLGILSSSIHWVLARSSIMHWFWSRAKGWTAKLLACPACSGFWIGVALGLSGVQPCAGYVSVTAGLAIFLTPVFEGVLLWGLEMAATPTVHERIAEEVAHIQSFYESHLATVTESLESMLRAKGLDEKSVSHILMLFDYKPSKEPDA